MSAIECLDRQQLEDYAAGRIPEQTADTVSNHIDTCLDCQAVLETTDDSDDSLVALLRRTPAPERYGDEPQYEQAMVRAEAAVGAMLLSGRRPIAEQTASTPDSRNIGEYELLEKLSQGGMGLVYKAFHTKLRRVVALKLLPRSRTNDEEAVIRFEREMATVGQLDHPNIVRATHAGEHQGTSYLVMEYVHGLDLSKLVRRCGPLSVPDACELIRQTAVGLQYVHENGLVHRDIKPSNLMLASDGRVKILDLGLALLEQDEPEEKEVTDVGRAMGTADYMAPEQVSDSHQVDIRADVYSLGCTLYKLLCGRAPFEDPRYDGKFEKMTAHVQQPVPSISPSCREVPSGLQAVLRRMLAKDPEERFAAPADVSEAVAPFAAGCDLPALLRRTGDPSSSPAQAPPAAGDDVHGAASPPVETVRRRALRSAPLPLRRRWKILSVAVGLMLLTLGTGLALQIIVKIKDRSGRETTVLAPPGSTVTIGESGRAYHALPEGVRLPAPDAPLPLAKLRTTIPYHVGPYACVQFSPDGKTLASACFGMGATKGTIKLWDPATGKRPAIWRGHRHTVLAVAYSPDGEILASSGKEDQEIRLWDAETGELLHTLAGHGARVNSVAFSPDGKTLASGGGEFDEDPPSDQTAVRLWDVATGELRRTLAGHRASVQSVAFSPDGRTLASASLDATVRLWDVQTGELRTTLVAAEPELHSGLYSVAFSPDGKTLAAGSEDTTVRFWDVETGEQTAVLEEHVDRVRSVAFSPDGRWLASAGHDRIVRLWDAATCKPLAALPGHKGDIWSVAFSPDGRTLASAGYDKKIMLWDLQPDPPEIPPR